MGMADVVDLPRSPRGKKREAVIRKGDFVRVVVPRFVTRVGYPKSNEDYLKELREVHRGALDTLLQTVLGQKRGKHLPLQKRVRQRDREKVERELAYVMARADGFGGAERSLHWVEMPGLGGQVLEVDSVRSVYTGHYFPPSGGSGGMFDDDDYEPGGLADPKCHRLLRLRPPWLHGLEERLEIPVYHVAKVRKGEGS